MYTWIKAIREKIKISVIRKHCASLIPTLKYFSLLHSEGKGEIIDFISLLLWNIFFFLSIQYNIHRLPEFNRKEKILSFNMQSEAKVQRLDFFEKGIVSRSSYS